MTSEDWGPLFEAGAPHNTTDTSREAAESLSAIHLSALRRQILDALENAIDGLTCAQVEATLGLAHQTASPRLYELAYCHPPKVVFHWDDDTDCDPWLVKNLKLSKLEAGAPRPRRRRTESNRSARIYFLPIEAIEGEQP